MNPNQTKTNISVKIDDLVKALYLYESTLHKKFAYLPKRINGQWVWLTHYYVQYQARNPFMIWEHGPNKKIVYKCYTKEDIVAETLKGNVVNEQLLTTRKRSFDVRDK